MIGCLSHRNPLPHSTRCIGMQSKTKPFSLGILFLCFGLHPYYLFYIYSCAFNVINNVNTHFVLFQEPPSQRWTLPCGSSAERSPSRVPGSPDPDPVPRVEPPQGVHCCPLSLWYLDAEIQISIQRSSSGLLTTPQGSRTCAFACWPCQQQSCGSPWSSQVKLCCLCTVAK